VFLVEARYHCGSPVGWSASGCTSGREVAVLVFAARGLVATESALQADRRRSTATLSVTFLPSFRALAGLGYPSPSGLASKENEDKALDQD
jgi:hypothetical protein